VTCRLHAIPRLIGEVGILNYIQLYSYSFAPNPNWSSTYASQPEILSYIEHVAAKHGVAEYIRPNQECLGAIWTRASRLMGSCTLRTALRHWETLGSAVEGGNKP
jgi:hypothetical protein